MAGGTEPVVSMSGFGRSEGVSGDTAWAVEMRSVNHKGLDIKLRLPSSVDGLDTDIRRLVQSRLRRGSAQITISLKHQGTATGLRVNRDLLEELIELAKEAEAKHGLSCTLDGLLAVRGVVETEDREIDETAREALLAALRSGSELALDHLSAMRIAEGAHLAASVSEKILAIESLTQQAEDRAQARAGMIRERVESLVAEAMAAETRLDRDRLEQEIAHVLVKADVREEIERLKAHVMAARDLLAQGGPIGRSLDFLCQEFNREANTLGSKANDAGLTTIALELKTIIDQMREQVQNIE